jgi:hypothetical protein
VHLSDEVALSLVVQDQGHSSYNQEYYFLLGKFPDQVTHILAIIEQSAYEKV